MFPILQKKVLKIFFKNLKREKRVAKEWKEATPDIS